jgi:hypothetical protein
MGNLLASGIDALLSAIFGELDEVHLYHHMMRTANPNHLERFGIIFVVSLNVFCGVAEDARAFLNTSSLDVDKEIRPAIGFSSLLCGWLV